MVMKHTSEFDPNEVASVFAVGEAWAPLWPGPETVVFGHDAKRRLQVMSLVQLSPQPGCLKMVLCFSNVASR